MQNQVCPTKQLADFFDTWRDLTQVVPLEKRLHSFFSQLKVLLPDKKESVTLKNVLWQHINVEEMNRFFGEMTQPIALAKQAGFFCDPWAIAKLKRDEVRNSSVLAWWLAPKGTHGLNDAFLSKLLKEINKKNVLKVPTVVSSRCRVRVESCPDGERASRVDIEIDDPGFFLIIEVKIDAPEGNDQLQRYCDIARKKCRDRPWAILFLTPQGRASQNMGDCQNASQDKPPIIALSWKEISVMLKAVTKQHTASFQGSKFPELALVDLLARSFCNHILQF